MDSDTILVDIQGTAPTPSLGPDTTLCVGEVLTLVSDADAETMIEWLDVATGSVVSTGSTTAVMMPGMYVLTETNHCGTASDTIEVEFEDAPAPFDLGGDMVICPGDTVLLHAPQTSDAILWETPGGASTSSATAVVQPGLVALTISNDCGIASDEIIIAFDPNEPEVVLDPVSLCDGESTFLDVTQPFSADYLWSTGSSSPVLQIATPGNYTVSVQTACYTVEESAQVIASADCDPQIYVPNVFSPNGDNINDFWEVQIDPALEFISIECKIFDRWGNTLFSTATTPILWDGSFNGSALLPGVYVYVLKLTTEEETRTLSGSLTLVR
jgi:gliding motility-associated-like protein